MEKQTQPRRLDSNLVRPFIQKFSLDTRDAAGCKSRNSAVKQEGQSRFSIGWFADLGDSDWSVLGRSEFWLAVCAKDGRDQGASSSGGVVQL